MPEWTAWPRLVVRLTCGGVSEPLAETGLVGVARTARWTAAARARESGRPDRLFHDPYARLLAGDDGQALLTYFHTPRAAAEGNPFLPIRTRWFDDFLAGAEHRQVVALGAGLDTRAFRLAWPEGTVVFEVDQPDLLAYKEIRLAGCRARCERRVVGVDLADDWGAALLRVGYRPDLPSAWFAEGLLFYLPEGTAHDVLSTAAELSAPGSVLGADLIGTGVFRFPYLREFLDRLAGAGSPWLFGTDEPEAFVTGTGWDVRVVAEPGQPGADYGRWPADAAPRGLRDLPRSYLVAAERGASRGRA